MQKSKLSPRPNAHLGQGQQSKTNKVILPPYSKSIQATQEFIVVYTGSDAWNSATSESWLWRIKKTLLPLGDDPESYKWGFVYGKDVLIFSHGLLESYARLVELSRCLLRYGAVCILWCIPEFKTMKFVNKGGT